MKLSVPSKPWPLRLYRIVCGVALWLATALAWLEKVLGRKCWPSRWRPSERLGWNWPPPPVGQVVWMHAASLGESKGLWALSQALSDLPVAFVLTAHTVAGHEYLAGQIQGREKPERWAATLAPLDHPRVVNRFLRHFRVQALLLFEVELWPHFILCARNFSLPISWVSARLTLPARKRYARFPRTTRYLLQRLSWAQAQDESTAKDLIGLGVKAATAGGDLRALLYLGEKKTWQFPWGQRRGIAFLSLHAAELSAILPALKLLDADTPVFVFPRKLQELSRFRARLQALGFELHSENPKGIRLLVNSFGRIPEFLPQCHVAVVGGSWAPRGGHNLWEPLLAGVSMVTGPHYWNQEYLARRLIDSRILRVALPPLSEQDLSKPAEDPFPACLDFTVSESKRLQWGVREIKEKLLAALPWVASRNVPTREKAVTAEFRTYF